MRVILIISYLLGNLVTPVQPDIPSSDATLESDAFTSTYTYNLHSINHISLNDSIHDVEDEIGKPNAIEKDEYLPDTEFYVYDNMIVTFQDGSVESVEIVDIRNPIIIDGISIPASLEQLSTALGGPDYIAEDGIVFQCNEALLKLFIHEDTGLLERIAYYHISST